jgi:type I restriction enzyme S subunit
MVAAKTKTTTVGEIPFEWEVVTLSEVADVRDGTHDSPKYVDKGVPFITSKNLKPNGIDFSDIKFISEEAHQTIQKRSKVDDGDILFGMIGTIGNPVIVKKEFEFSIKNVALIKFNNDSLNNKYLKYLLDTDYIKKQFQKISDGGVQKFVALGTIRKLEIPLPSKGEQHKIADILTSVDNTISKTEAIIEQTEKVKKGLMQQLLTKGIGHTKFKQTEIGEIPEEWGFHKLIELTDKITDGAHQSPKTCEDGLPIATVENMRDSHIDIESCRTISVEDFESLVKNSCAPDYNDVLLSKDGTIGKTLVFKQKERLVLLSSIAIIRPNNNLLYSNYLMYYLQSDMFYWNLERLRSGSAIKRIVLKDIKQIALPLPNIEEQMKISNILSSMDKKIINENSKLTKMQHIKKGLMQALLTGKVPVNVDQQKEVITK